MSQAKWTMARKPDQRSRIMCGCGSLLNLTLSGDEHILPAATRSAVSGSTEMREAKCDGCGTTSMLPVTVMRGSQ